MTNNEYILTPSAIRYLLTLSELSCSGKGARSVDIAEKMNVSKPGAYAMIRTLCSAGLAAKKKYGTVFLTDEGRAAADRYAECYEPLRRRMGAVLGLDEELCGQIACTVMAQAPDKLDMLARRLRG